MKAATPDLEQIGTRTTLGPSSEISTAGQNRSREPWRTLKASHQHERQLWLIRMRWIAIVCVLGTVSVASLANWIRSLPQLLTVTAFMVVYNALFLKRWKVEHLKESWRFEENPVFLPILFDLASLTMLLHWSGGIENPFALFFAFHMAIGATLLSTRGAYVLAGAASLLWGGTVVLEHARVLPHHSLFLGVEPNFAFTATGTSSLILVGYLAAFMLTMFGVIYFVRSVEEGRWQAERRALQRERVTLAREKMARIGEITAGVAHTLRNPLQGVITSLDLLRDTYLVHDPSARELADIMDQGLQRVERVTRRLLTLTRGRHFSVVLTDINHLIADHLGFLKTRAQDKGISIVIEPGVLPELRVDPEALGEALMNIVDNAIQACSEGDRILIETGKCAHGTGRGFIRICDSGPGIPTDFAGKVFEPFFTSKAVGEGSGLGLAISLELIEEHQGSLLLVDDPAWSTCFEVELPFVPIEERV